MTATVVFSYISVVQNNNIVLFFVENISLNSLLASEDEENSFKFRCCLEQKLKNGDVSDIINLLDKRTRKKMFAVFFQIVS